MKNQESGRALVLRRRSRLLSVALMILLTTVGCPSNPPRNPPADVVVAPDVVADAPEAAVLDDASSNTVADSIPVPDAPDATPPVDAGIQVQLTFVSAAIQGSSADGGVSVQAQMSWHASIVGSSADGRISVRGVMY